MSPSSQACWYKRSVTWEATRLTRVRAKVERSILPTGADGASSKVKTRVSLRGRHELFRNLILSAEAVYFREDFKQLGRKDDSYRVRAGVEYRINRFFSVIARHTYRERDSSRNGRDYRSNITMLTVDFTL